MVIEGFLEDFLGLMFFQIFCPSPWTTCVVLLVMILDVRLQVIFPFRLPITCFPLHVLHFWVMYFVLNFDFFFLLLFLCQMFFLY
jgi:hypothetical protein